MREVEVIDGATQAKACSLYVMHRDADLRAKLDKVLPGASWEPWREAGESLSVAEVAMLIRSRLRQLEGDGVRRVSSRALKSQVAPGAPTTTWQRARDAALNGASWIVHGSSLVIPFEAETA